MITLFDSFKNHAVAALSRYATITARIGLNRVAVVTPFVTVDHAVSTMMKPAIGATCIGSIIVVVDAVVTLLHPSPQQTVPAPSVPAGICAGVEVIVIPVFTLLTEVPNPISAAGQPAVGSAEIRSGVRVERSLITLFYTLPDDSVAAAGVLAGMGALVGGYQVAVVAFLDGDPEDSVAAAGFLAGVGATVMGVLVGIVAFFAGFNYAIAAAGSRNRATTSDQQ